MSGLDTIVLILEGPPKTLSVAQGMFSRRLGGIQTDNIDILRYGLRILRLPPYGRPV